MTMSLSLVPHPTGQSKSQGQAHQWGEGKTHLPLGEVILLENPPFSLGLKICCHKVMCNLNLFFFKLLLYLQLYLLSHSKSFILSLLFPESNSQQSSSVIGFYKELASGFIYLDYRFVYLFSILLMSALIFILFFSLFLFILCYFANLRISSFFIFHVSSLILSTFQTYLRLFSFGLFLHSL